ncbi:MAG: AmpG family muropeptide MFS transporter [Bacteroidales bacterium]|nr:AmpG family muropeptide MFS transporter [Bacteroidales bacterium]
MLARGLKHKSNSFKDWLHSSLWIPSLYLAEGLPNAIVVTLAVVLLKNMGLDNGSVAFYTSLLYLPWVIKPFWAPFVDMFSTKRQWIVITQLLLFISLGAIGFVLPTQWWLAAVLIALWSTAFFSATHDIAADGFYMLALTPQQQSAFVGFRSLFYRIANLVASGGLVWLAGRFAKTHGTIQSWSLIFWGTGAFFLIVAIYHFLILPRPANDRPNKANSIDSVINDFGKTFVTFFRKPQIIISLSFMLLYRLPEAILGKMVQPFLLDSLPQGGLGLSVEQVGLANGTFGVIGIIAGGIIGGIIIAIFGLKKCLWPMALALTIPSAFYCYLAAIQPNNMILICSGIAVEQFGYGFGFTAYMMYLMKFCEGTSFATSHYAFSTGIMALGLMLPGLVAGEIEMAVGYPLFFTIVMILCIPTFIVTALVYRTLKD